jgi:hypothetical protein
VVVVKREVSTHGTAVMSFRARTSSAKSGSTYDLKSTSQVKTSNRHPRKSRPRKSVKSWLDSMTS